MFQNIPRNFHLFLNNIRYTIYARGGWRRASSPEPRYPDIIEEDVTFGQLAQVLPKIFWPEFDAQVQKRAKNKNMSVEEADYVLRHEASLHAVGGWRTNTNAGILAQGAAHDHGKSVVHDIVSESGGVDSDDVSHEDHADQRPDELLVPLSPTVRVFTRSRHVFVRDPVGSSASLGREIFVLLQQGYRAFEVFVDEGVFVAGDAGAVVLAEDDEGTGGGGGHQREKMKSETAEVAVQQIIERRRKNPRRLLFEFLGDRFDAICGEAGSSSCPTFGVEDVGGVARTSDVLKEEIKCEENIAGGSPPPTEADDPRDHLVPSAVETRTDHHVDDGSTPRLTEERFQELTKGLYSRLGVGESPPEFSLVAHYVQAALEEDLFSNTHYPRRLIEVAKSYGYDPRGEEDLGVVGGFVPAWRFLGIRAHARHDARKTALRMLNAYLRGKPEVEGRPHSGRGHPKEQGEGQEERRRIRLIVVPQGEGVSLGDHDGHEDTSFEQNDRPASAGRTIPARGAGWWSAGDELLHPLAGQGYSVATHILSLRAITAENAAQVWVSGRKPTEAVRPLRVAVSVLVGALELRGRHRECEEVAYSVSDCVEEVLKQEGHAHSLDRDADPILWEHSERLATHTQESQKSDRYRELLAGAGRKILRPRKIKQYLFSRDAGKIARGRRPRFLRSGHTRAEHFSVPSSSQSRAALFGLRSILGHSSVKKLTSSLQNVVNFLEIQARRFDAQCMNDLDCDPDSRTWLGSDPDANRIWSQLISAVATDAARVFREWEVVHRFSRKRPVFATNGGLREHRNEDAPVVDHGQHVEEHPRRGHKLDEDGDAKHAVRTNIVVASLLKKYLHVFLDAEWSNRGFFIDEKRLMILLDLAMDIVHDLEQRFLLDRSGPRRHGETAEEVEESSGTQTPGGGIANPEESDVGFFTLLHAWWRLCKNDFDNELRQAWKAQILELDEAMYLEVLELLSEDQASRSAPSASASSTNDLLHQLSQAFLSLSTLNRRSVAFLLRRPSRTPEEVGTKLRARESGLQIEAVLYSILTQEEKGVRRVRDVVSYTGTVLVLFDVLLCSGVLRALPFAFCQRVGERLRKHRGALMYLFWCKVGLCCRFMYCLSQR